MPLTDAQLAALTPETAAVASVRVMNEGLAEQIDTANKHEAALLAQDAAFKAQNELLARIAAALENRTRLSPARAAFTELVGLCMAASTRTLTLSSTDATRADAAVNAVEMALAAWPAYKGQLDTLP
jgi:hypothetical protein